MPRSVLLTLLLTAAAWLTSVSETCQRLRGAPNDQAVRLALILRNVWGWLHLQVLAKYQPGGRHIELALLPFPQLMWWLGQQAIARFGLVDVLTTEYPIETANRDRGKPHDFPPPTPPGIRVRTRAVRLS